MAEGRRREHLRRNARRRDRLGALAVVVLACVAGVVAGVLASPQPWQFENRPGTPVTSAPGQGSP
jgi:ferric-dicitrate binding protein FerR (iron transport regulator)